MVLVVGNHRGKRQLRCPLGGQSQAHQPTTMGDHEVDYLRCRVVGRGNKVALVLTVLVVHDNDHLATSDRSDRLGHLAQGQCGLVDDGGGVQVQNSHDDSRLEKLRCLRRFGSPTRRIVRKASMVPSPFEAVRAMTSMQHR